ncbi:MAG TPA: hypothetical protein VGR20_01495 [Acidimicrobiia bacterium]|nr:hypothetical protein [Acidimicrobiia bacterium]
MPYSIEIVARLGGAEMSVIAGGALFFVLIGFFLFWGGPPNSGR